jgi:TrmH family RNA methyltransferase
MDVADRFRAARRDLSLVVLEGFHAFKHALRFGAGIESAICTDPDAVGRLAAELAPDLAGLMPPLLQVVSTAHFAASVPGPPPTGVIALARRPDVDPGAILDAASPEPAVLLDRPKHLGNIGAVVRVAAAAGAAGVLTTGDRDPWHPTAVRGSAGLHFAVPVARIETLDPGSRPLVAVAPTGTPLPEARIPDAALLAFGSERHGLGRELAARAECRIAIPMRPGVSSLNLATAVAVVLYAGGFRHR